MSPEFGNQPQPKIVETTIDDVLAYRTFHAKSWLDTYPNEAAGVEREWVEERVAAWTTDESIQKSKDFVEPMLASPNHLHRIAKVGDKVVGLAHVSNGNGRQYVEALYVDIDYQGTGLAKDMMDIAMSWLDSSRDTTLDVVTYNQRAVKFYEKYGFEIIPGSDHLFADKFPVVTMIKKGITNEV